MAPSEGEQTFESAMEEEGSRIGDEPATTAAAASCVAPVEDSASVGILIMREKRREEERRGERQEMAAFLHLLAGVSGL